jgi:hypothetical protein
MITDFSKILHSVDQFTGDRYSLVFYWFQTSRSVDLPPPSVREENGKWFFYRGEQKITRQIGLPHPLRGKKKKNIQIGIQLEEKEVEVGFP